MSPRYLRSLIVLISFVASLTAAGPAQAGPPLLCHPFDIGDARSLPWDGSTGWSKGRTDYALDRLVRDTETMLGPSTPVIVRMETLRRAAIYASRDRKVAALLLDRLSSRAHAAEQMARPDPLPLLDAAYLTEAFRPIGMLGGTPEFREGAPMVRALVNDANGTVLMAKSLAARPGDAALEFAAALMVADKDRSAYEEHARKARAGARADPLLARNLSHVS